VDPAGDNSGAGVIGDTVAYDSGVVALRASGEEVDAAGARNEPVVDCLPFFLAGVRGPKIEDATLKSPLVSITSIETARLSAARHGGKGVALSLSSDQSPLSDIVLLDY
jgi:hypothetical protein